MYDAAASDIQVSLQLALFKRGRTGKYVHCHVGVATGVCAFNSLLKLRLHQPAGLQRRRSEYSNPGSHHLPEPGRPGSNGAAGDGDGGGCGEAGEGVPGAGVPDVTDPRHRPRPPHPVAAHGAMRPRRQPRGPRRPCPRALLRRSPNRRRGVPRSREQRRRSPGPGIRFSVPLRPSPSLGFVISPSSPVRLLISSQLDPTICI
jgi:hypothetical protein